jgi:hypothetical protein
MRLMDLAKELGADICETKRILKKKSHMAVLKPAEIAYAKTYFAEPSVSSPEVSFPSAPASGGSAPVVKAVKPVEKPVEPDLALIAASIKGCGGKSPFWHLRHLVGRK